MMFETVLALALVMTHETVNFTVSTEIINMGTSTEMSEPMKVITTRPATARLVVSWPALYPCLSSLRVNKSLDHTWAECDDPGYVDVYTRAGVVRVNRETGEVRKW